MYNLIANPITKTEPVSVDYFKTYARLNSASAGEDEIIADFISTAREYVEQECRTDFITKIKTAKFPVNVNLPDVILSDNIISISGAYSTLEEIQNAYSYFVEYVKGFSISRDYPIDFLNPPTYTLTYVVRVLDIPITVKTVICKIASELNENRETSTSLANYSLSFADKRLLAPYKKQLI